MLTLLLDAPWYQGIVFQSNSTELLTNPHATVLSTMTQAPQEVVPPPVESSMVRELEQLLVPAFCLIIRLTNVHWQRHEVTHLRGNSLPPLIESLIPHLPRLLPLLRLLLCPLPRSVQATPQLVSYSLRRRFPSDPSFRRYLQQKIPTG